MMPYKDPDVRRAKARDYTAAYREKNRKPTPIAECPRCKSEFEVTRSDKQFCSRRCKANAWGEGLLYRGRDPEKRRKAALRSYHSDPEAKRKALERQKQNLSLYAFHTAKRRAASRRAMPDWVDQDAIREIYDACPKGWHVDHIEPLQGKDVCGLHVPWNLQHLPASENLSKGNRRER